MKMASGVIGGIWQHKRGISGIINEKRKHRR